MNILYLPCHEVLEYDELRMLTEIPGVNVMSPGAYWKPSKGARLRLPLNIPRNQEWIDAWNSIPASPGQDHKLYITPQALEPYDAIIVMHKWSFIYNNLEAFQGKKVIWRDIGQTVPKDEVRHIKRVQDSGVKIVRYWDGYQDRKDYQGHDAIIPFGKYPEDFHTWTGEEKVIAGCCNNIANRAKVCRTHCWDHVTSDLPAALYGILNHGEKHHQGSPDYHTFLKHLSRHRVMWYGGTKPAPYTLAFLEALFTGLPLFGVSSPGWETALPGLLDSSQLAPDTWTLKMKMKDALTMDPSEWLQSLSEKQVKVAREQFSATRVKKLWKKFLFSL